MRTTIECIIYMGEKQYVAECLDFPVITQGTTLDDTVANLKEAISLHLEDENLSELGFVESPQIDIKFETGELANVS
ncbi:type II toxin-antitoxin system HicB family antitoxin [bacterium]|nr:type II toxin-antitoxin system HicB family antitoxin [bacterium]